MIIYPDMNKLVVRLLRTEPPLVDVCHYAAARIEELEAEVAKRNVLLKEMAAELERLSDHFPYLLPTLARYHEYIQ